MSAPDDLLPDTIGRTVSEMAGREKRYVSVPFDALEQNLLEHGLLGDFARGYVAMMRAKNECIDNVVRRTPATTSPTAFSAWDKDVLKSALSACIIKTV